MGVRRTGTDGRHWTDAEMLSNSRYGPEMPTVRSSMSRFGRRASSAEVGAESRRFGRREIATFARPLRHCVAAALYRL